MFPALQRLRLHWSHNRRQVPLPDERDSRRRLHHPDSVPGQSRIHSILHPLQCQSQQQGRLIGECSEDGCPFIVVLIPPRVPENMAVLASNRIDIATSMYFISDPHPFRCGLCRRNGVVRVEWGPPWGLVHDVRS